MWTKLTDPVKIERLRVIDISGNPLLKTLPPEVHTLTNLKALNAANCSFQRLHALTGMHRLQQLRLDRNDLETDTIGVLPRTLTHIYLRDNHLRTIPSNFEVLERIIFLDLSGNRLEELRGIEVLVTLQELHLDKNCLRELPDTIGAMIKLTIVSLRDNQIAAGAVSREGQSLPSELFTRTSLERLDLTNNPLRQAEIMQFDGVSVFLERRRSTKEKALHGGGLVDVSLFGLH